VLRVRYVGSDDLGVSACSGADALRLNEEYVVLEVYARPFKSSYFRIEYRDGELPPVFDARMFEVTSTIIPHSWEVYLLDRDVIFGPAEWKVEGFWEALMDQEKWARSLYLTMRDRIISESAC
jgi:hypothetical protein